MPRKWTREFEDELRAHYAEGFAACKKCVANFSVAAIQQHACRLGLSRKIDFWTDEEIGVLREFFEKRGKEYCAERLSNKTLRQVSSKASRLGLKHRRLPVVDWSGEELKLLRRRYRKIGAKGCAELLDGKTALQCGKQARSMGLRTYPRS